MLFRLAEVAVAGAMAAGEACAGVPMDYMGDGAFWCKPVMASQGVQSHRLSDAASGVPGRRTALKAQMGGSRRAVFPLLTVFSGFQGR